MSVEHRWSARKAVHLEAVIFHRPLGLVRGEVLDVSLEGVRLDTGRFILPEQVSVELTFALPTTDKAQIHQMEAIVVHRHGTHHGLMFRNFKLNAFQAIRDILYAA